MKKDTTNTFQDGLNLDLHPIVTPNSVLTDNLNGTFITYNGNEFCLQNDKGNTYKCSISEGFTPIGAKEHNGVIYIASVNDSGESEIGFYPGITDWSITDTSGRWGYLNNETYSPLKNLSTKRESIAYNLQLSGWKIESDSEWNEVVNKLELFGVSANEANKQKGRNFIEFKIVENEYSIDDCVAAIADLGYFNEVKITATIRDYEIVERNSFRTSKLNFSKEYPVTIEIQDSYDGSVNLILTDDNNPVRIINTGFTVVGNKYQVITRNQEIETNLYDEDQFTEQTNLVRITNKITNATLNTVKPGGQLKGGNYKFYIKFGDADFNQSDIVAESGIVSIFNGTDGRPDTISGTLADERTDKMVSLSITGLNAAYSKIYIYYTREYSDTNGYRMSEAAMLTEPFEMMPDGTLTEPLNIWITGFEQITPISVEDLNIDYHTVDYAKTITQQQDMLFLGNVGQKETFELYRTLEGFTKRVTTTVKQDTTLDAVSCDYKTGDEYYSTRNIHDKLGYWPDEIYRFGIVYILKDGSTTPAFNMRGGSLSSINESIGADTEVENANDYGIFKTPNVGVITDNTIYPISFEFKLPDAQDSEKEQLEKVIGWFVVRQKRIPRTICQGLSIGIDKDSHLPMIWNGHDWIIESFLSLNRDILTLTSEEIQKVTQEYLPTHLKEKQDCNYWGLLNFILPGAGDIAMIKCSGATDSQITSQITSLIEESKTSEKIPELTYLYSKRAIAKASKYYCYYNIYDDSILTHISRLDEWKKDPARADYYIIDEIVNKRADKCAVHELEMYSKDDSNVILLKILLLTDLNTASPQDIVVEYNGSKYRVPVYIGEQFAKEADGDIQTYRIIHESDLDLNGWGLLTLDPCVNNTIAGTIDGSEFIVRREYNTETAYGVNPETDEADLDNNYNGEFTRIDSIKYEFNNLDIGTTGIPCVYVGKETRNKSVNGFSFSNIAGNANSFTDYNYTTKQLFLKKTGNDKDAKLVYSTDNNNDSYNINIVRGIFTPFVGIPSTYALEKEGIYSIRQQEPAMYLMFKVREQDNSPYYTISKRFEINSTDEEVFGGDCYSSTVTMRILRNFIDPTTPYVDRIVRPNGWKEYLIALDNETSTGEALLEAEKNVNLADVNAVDLGYWVTFKCLSSYNLGLRSENRFNTEELALMGSHRSFYPISGLSTATGNKVEESYLLNDGLSATVGQKRYLTLNNPPYSKSDFSTRVMFSNKQVTDAFTNGYRTIQGLSYHDYDKQYGEIVKLLPWGNNLFCVFEHGLAILPINEKALMQTTTEQTIHIYGHGVLPDQMSIVSQDYGSRYADSVIRTPLGVYGIDVDAKKIWRFTDKQGFETISDMKIESFLNLHLKPENHSQISVGTNDVRTHYNSFKGDVIFTWYYDNEEFSICFNERQSVWTTRYDWIPIVSENINGEFYSLQTGLDSNNTVGIYHHNPIDSRPTKWYGKQHVFEFEFVVSDPIGVHKIYDDLQIISNNVQPEELSFEIIGDAYMFNKSRLYHTVYDGYFNHNRLYGNETTDKKYVNRDDPEFTKDKTESAIYKPFRNASKLNDRGGKTVYGDILKTDNATEQYHLRIPQECRNIETWGRRLGNIHYKNDSWYTNIEPIIYDARLNDPNITTFDNNIKKWSSARIRDKWCKIRVRYSGEDLSVITAIKTSLNI